MEGIAFFELFTGAGELSSLVAAGLIALTFITSIITATIGIGGGVLLLATMATVMPLAALIPVHGLVQLGTNGSRAFMTRQHTDWNMVKWFVAGALIGAVMASFIVVQLPLVAIQFAIAGFILFLVWGPKQKNRELGDKGRFVAGIFTLSLIHISEPTRPY